MGLIIGQIEVLLMYDILMFSTFENVEKNGKKRISGSVRVAVWSASMIGS